LETCSVRLDRRDSHFLRITANLSRHLLLPNKRPMPSINTKGVFHLPTGPNLFEYRFEPFPQWRYHPQISLFLLGKTPCFQLYFADASQGFLCRDYTIFHIRVLPAFQPLYKGAIVSESTTVLRHSRKEPVSTSITFHRVFWKRALSCGTLRS
jgi:hypothetical protein